MPRPTITLDSIAAAEALWQRQLVTMQDELKQLEAELESARLQSQAAAALVPAAQAKFDAAQALFRQAEQELANRLSDCVATSTGVQGIQTDIGRLKAQIARHLAPPQ